jgi:hypothetical protein
MKESDLPYDEQTFARLEASASEVIEQVEAVVATELIDAPASRPLGVLDYLPEELAGFLRWSGSVLRALSSALFYGGGFVLTSVVGYVRHHPVHSVVNLAVAGFAVLLLATGFRVNEELVSMKLSDSTVHKIAVASRYTRAYTLEEPDTRGTREFMSAGAPGWVQREAIRAILETAREVRLSLEHQAVLLTTAEIESGFNPMATATTTTACGVFQFIRSTGKVFGLDASECLDPWKSSKAEIAHYLANYKRRIESQVASIAGPEKLIKMFELSYYLHHDGPLSSEPSPELKATVLAGVPFLFRVYEILDEERAARQLEPSFLHKLRMEMDQTWAMAVAVPRRLRAMLPATRRADGELKDAPPVEKTAG